MLLHGDKVAKVGEPVRGETQWAAAAEVKPVERGHSVPGLVIESKDFLTSFDGTAWVMRWKWKDGPPKLQNRISCYGNTIKPDLQEPFDAEIGQWIAYGWLRPWITETNERILPLLAVEQKNKGKVRPFLDYRELNEFVQCHRR